MATVGEHLKASVEFGGKIDPTWTRSIGSMEKNIASLMGSVSSKTRKQTVLAEKMKKAMMEGRSVQQLKKMREEYAHLGREISEATGQQKRLNVALERARRFEVWRGRGKGALRGGLSVSASIAKWSAGGLLAGAAGALTSPVMLNQETAEKAGLARSYGVSAPTFMAWDSLAKNAGLNGENVGDLFEEWKNKVGQYDPTDKNAKNSAIGTALPQLGMNAGVFAGKSNQQQVEMILTRLLKMKDGQAAASIADQLFGGEANKLITFMRMTGKSYQTLIEEQKRYNLVTSAGADGALRGNWAFNNLWTVFTSGAAEISGLLGGELAPQITHLADDLKEWFRGGGIEKIKTFIRGELIPDLFAFGRGVSLTARVVYALARKLSWLIPDGDEEKQREARRQTLVALGDWKDPEVARKVARDNGTLAWFNQKMASDPQLRSKVVSAQRQGRGWFGNKEGMNQTLDALAGDTDNAGAFSGTGLLQQMQLFLSPSPSSTSGTEAAPVRLPYGLRRLDESDRAVSQTVTNAPTFNFVINAAQGQSTDAIADSVENRTRSAGAFVGMNTLGDMPTL
ncbi:hypothetical protein OP068_004765 [Salmonella enterica]|nr:hypothetical protein [Salmonella enterica subsp. enterica]EKC4652966.1 hypothetical protein [Salmonella enterica]